MLSSEAMPPTLMTIPLDLQIRICAFLHPSDILALRETCKDIRSTTKQRIIWIDALRRICLANGLFLPSFPIPEMSDVELERAAMAPCRWIKLCTTLDKRQSDDATLYDPIKTRIIHNLCPGPESSSQVFLVPGGRYLVTCSFRRLDVWDLGYTPNSEGNLLASVGMEWEYSSCLVNVNSNGMSLIIVTSRVYQDCSVYEIYPQSENPQLTQIAHLCFDPNSRNASAYLLPERVVWYTLYLDRIVFRVWDYRLNHSASFSAYVEVGKFSYNIEVIPTMTAIIAIYEEEILLWGIPPLSHQPPDFSDQHPAYMPALVRVAFQDDLIRKVGLYQWKVISGWYHGSSQPLYFDAICGDMKCHGFEIIIKPDINDVSLRIANTSQLTTYDFDNFIFGEYIICEDAIVFWNIPVQNEYRVHIRSTSSSPVNVISSEPTVLNASLSIIGSPYSPSLCPASGRLVYMDKLDNYNIVVVDFLPYL